MSKKISMEKKISNSNLKVTKNYLYFMIASVLILLVGLILCCTIGFNLGIDFTGYSSVKIYVNNEATFQNVESYDLNDSEDYNTVYGKVKSVFKDNELKIISYRTTTINLMDNYNIPDGQAVEVVFQNNSTKESVINDENQTLRNSIIAEFDYSNFDNAVSSVDYSPVQSSFNWLIGLLAAIVFGLLASIIYFMFRYSKSAWMVLILQTALDILLFVGLLAICRLTINLTIGISIIATFVISIINVFAYYSKMKENISSGKFAGMKNSEMADANIKEGLFKKSLLYIIMLVLIFLLAIIAVEGVREVALGLAIALIVTFFTSTFFTPVIWSVVYKEKKKKQAQI